MSNIIYSITHQIKSVMQEVTFYGATRSIFCYDKKEDRCNNNKCFGIITVILAIAFSFVVGLLVGAVAIASEIVASFGAIIVLAVVLGLLLILSIILLICNRKKDKKRKCCC